MNDVNAIVEATKELLTLHELIAHRLVQILIGQHRGAYFLAITGVWVDLDGLLSF